MPSTGSPGFGGIVVSIIEMQKATGDFERHAERDDRRRPDHLVAMQREDAEAHQHRRDRREPAGWRHHDLPHRRLGQGLEDLYADDDADGHGRQPGDPRGRAFDHLDG